MDLPALRTSLLSSLDLNSAQVLLVSHSSLPQQHVHTLPLSGSGEDSRETLVKVWVSSSMVVVARCKLLVSCESGVRGRESSDIVHECCRRRWEWCCQCEGGAASSRSGV